MCLWKSILARVRSSCAAVGNRAHITICHDYTTFTHRQALLERASWACLRDMFRHCFPSWVRWREVGPCIPLSDKALITRVSAVSSKAAQHVTSRSPPPPQRSNPTPRWQGAALEPWLTWVKCLKHHSCQIMKWTEMYARGLASSSCKLRDWGRIQPHATTPPLNEKQTTMFCHHISWAQTGFFYSIYCQHQSHKNRVCRWEHHKIQLWLLKFSV